MPTSNDVTIENVREPHVGSRASPYTASNAHAVRVGGVPTDSNGTNNDSDYSRARRPSSSPSASTASRTFDYKPTTHTRFETSSPTSDGAQFTFLEQLRRDAAARGGDGTIGDATRYERKATFKHGYAKHWDVPESGSPARDVVTSIGAIGTLAAGNVAAPADVGTREARRKEAMEYDFNWREKESRGWSDACGRRGDGAGGAGARSRYPRRRLPRRRRIFQRLRIRRRRNLRRRRARKSR